MKVYSNSQGGEIKYYRDRNGLEADAVLILDTNEYCLIEFKLGSNGIEEGAKHLLKLKDIILSNNLKPPKFEMIITGTDMAYTRKDGIKVVPIGCLGVW